MSLNRNQEETLLDLRMDFDFFLRTEKWSECAAIIQSVGDLGQENEALSMHKRLNSAKDPELTFEPVEDAWSPPLLPEEDDAPARDASQWRQEGDEKFPV